MATGERCICETQFAKPHYYRHCAPCITTRTSPAGATVVLIKRKKDETQTDR